MKALAQGVEAVSVTPAGGSDAEGHAYAQMRFDGSDPAAVLIEEGLAAAQHIAILSWRG
jgi:hypothetical protein